MSALARYTKYQWAVIYQRRGWQSHQTRYFQSKRGATKLANKLLAGTGHLAPLTTLVVERRPLGDPEEIWRMR